MKTNDNQVIGFAERAMLAYMGIDAIKTPDDAITRTRLKANGLLTRDQIYKGERLFLERLDAEMMWRERHGIRDGLI